MPESTGKSERKRISVACDSCFAKKVRWLANCGIKQIKCDDAVPRCNWCMHHGLPCTFTRKSLAKRKKPSKDCVHRSTRVEKRIVRIETPVYDYLHGSNDLSPPGEGIGARCEPTHGEHGLQPLLGEWHFAGIKLGGVGRHNGIPFFSIEGLQWVESRCGQNANLERFARFFHSWGTNPRSISDSPGPLESQNYSQLPDRETIEAYLASFQSSAQHQIFPLVKDSLFNDTIRRAYQRPQHPSGSLDAVSCVYAFAAFAAAINLRNNALPPINGTDCAKEAQNLLSKVLQTPATLDTLQTVLMLSALRLLSGDLSCADILLAIAIRLVFQLGGNQFRPPSATFVGQDDNYAFEERAQVRTLFWVCYTMDRCLFLRTGRPPSIHDDDCDLTLPENYIEKTSKGGFETEETTDSFTLLFPCDLRLSMVISNIYRELYSIRGLQKSDAEILMTIRKLDHDLETWRMSITSQKWPQSSASDSCSMRMVDTRSLMNRLEYHQCMGIIHQASSRCISWREDTSDVSEGINSSLALAVEASRSSLLYLNLVQGTVDEETVWFIMFYPISAIMTIFCYILLKPQDPRSVNDLQLLNKVPVLMKALLAHRSHSIEPMHVQFVEDFVGDLSHLAKSAIFRNRSCYRSNSGATDAV